ncbi:MAG: hypothetical protein ACO2ON_03800 [Candidatus Nanopusillus sp.]
MDRFNYDDYIDTYPPYEYVSRYIKDTSVFAFIRRDLQLAKKHIEKIYPILELIEQYAPYSSYVPYNREIYILLDNIKAHIEKLRDIIGNTRSKVRKISREQVLSYYLFRIQTEILDGIESEIGVLQHKIKNNVNVSRDLILFVRETTRKLDEFERFINEIQMHI